MTTSKDGLIKIFDIRMMREIYSLKGHKKEVTGEVREGEGGEVCPCDGSIIIQLRGIDFKEIVDKQFWEFLVVIFFS